MGVASCVAGSIRARSERASLERAWEDAAIEQDVLPGDEAGVGRAQERAGRAELVGLTAFLAGIARSVAQHNVTINFMLPGPFDTDRLRSNHEITAKKQGVPVEQVAAQKKAAIPAKRFGDADEFGATCAFLCSTHAGFITGQNILIDGGIFPGAF